ncbi:MAG: HEAT repeat domain-containing protein [Kofleriaceae bacterium]
MTELAKMLSSSSNEKARLSAVVALAKLGDKTALKPLVTALADPSVKVRIVAAVGLGRLGHKAALPALRSAATDDSDDTVRTRARDAAIAIAKSNKLPDPFSDSADAVATTEAPKKKAKAGFGNAPRAIESHPDLYIVIKSSADDSPGTTDKPARKTHADIIRQSLAEQCRSAINVTSLAADAQRWGLDLRNIDLSVVKMAVTQVGDHFDVEAQLRIAISDDKGKMLSFLSNGATISVPKSSLNPRTLPRLRKEVLEGAMHGMFDKLIAHLRDLPKS